jgi:FkbM family methyltransferase
VTHALHAPAKAIRRALIAVRLDRPLADLTKHRPRHWLARFFRPDIIDYRGCPPRRAIRGGITYDLDLSDYIEWTIYFGIERDEKTALFELAETGQTVLDIGTNVGEVLMNLADRVGNDGRAIGFEPNPQTLLKCRHNLGLNGFANVEVHELALGDRPGHLLLGRPQQTNAGADRIVRSGDKAVEVQVTTLDEFVSERKLERIDLIKIDVEGFDLNVLRGGQQSIERFRPTLFIELSHANLREQGDHPAALVKWLYDRGYSVADAVSGATITAEDDFNNCFTDIIASPGLAT